VEGVRKDEVLDKKGPKEMKDITTRYRKDKNRAYILFLTIAQKEMGKGEPEGGLARGGREIL